ncbi:MAG TPA: hypothetical protein VKR41_09015 [Puia sp.]|nr:hypothetical protein [Puia sp.]
MTIKRYLYLVLGTGVATLPGCIVRQAFFVSPFNGNNLEYHPIPKAGDSIHAAGYSSLSYSNGSANDFGTDYLWSLHLSVHAAHQYNHVQFHYGLGLTLGDYTMGRWRVDTGYRGYSFTPNTALPTAAQLNSYSGRYSFGGVGFQGGINGVMPFSRGEWRYLGVETSVTREYGNYLAVRKQMPDSIATLINRNPTFATVGMTTEIVGHVRSGEFGFKWALGWALGHRYSNPGIVDNTNGDPLRYMYFNFTFHYTYRQLTSYLQFNDATKARLIFAGVNYRLWAGR